ncbi:MAG: hypothetical protein OEV92_06630 [Nitrospinota bacterium]|nr:hypothetical protein [Nitrospinota bacterium]
MVPLKKIAFQTLSIFASSILIFACNSGSGGGSDTSQVYEKGSPFLAGTYDFKVAVAIANCSDGSQPSQGFGFSVEMIQTGTFLEARLQGQTVGRGDLDLAGKFHMSGAMETPGGKLVVILDGQVDGKTLSGESKSAFESADGQMCSHVSSFTAAPGKGGA